MPSISNNGYATSSKGCAACSNGSATLNKRCTTSCNGCAASSKGCATTSNGYAKKKPGHGFLKSYIKSILILSESLVIISQSWYSEVNHELY